jgi:vacuolar iron transporter family protein
MSKPLVAPPELHRIHRVNWLRAAVLGANDGIVSTASLLMGVAAAGASPKTVLISGIASLVAGAMSMAAGEYVSVSSQADTERADLELEKQHLLNDPDYEHHELREIYIGRGLEPDLAEQVAKALMRHDALGAHARDELGISEVHTARPILAALASAVSFALGAIIPIATAVSSATKSPLVFISGASLFTLAVLGAVAAGVGGAPKLRATLRVTLWGALAMSLTSGVGFLFGIAT